MATSRLVLGRRRYFSPQCRYFHCLHTVTSLHCYHHRTTTVLWPFFRDQPGEPVPEENFWTLWCKGRLYMNFYSPSGWAPLHPDKPVPNSTIPPSLYC